ALQPLLARAHLLRALPRRLSGRDPLPVPRPVPLVPPARAGGEGMGARAQANVAGSVPVGGVVAAAQPRPREVGDLVVLEAGRTEPLGREQVLGCVAVLVRELLLAGAHPAAERRLLLRRQAVE